MWYKFDTIYVMCICLYECGLILAYVHAYVCVHVHMCAVCMHLCVHTCVL